MTKNGKRKQLWFSAEQIDLLERLKEITHDTGSNIVREALKNYKEKLIKQSKNRPIAIDKEEEFMSAFPGITNEELDAIENTKH